MKKFKNVIKTDEEIKAELDEEKNDPNSMDVVVDRVEHGLVGSLRVTDDMNSPLFVVGDIIHIRVPAKLEKKDFVLYLDHDEYYIRRIVKFKEDDIYVAGDTERHFHIIQKENVIGKVLARERKNKHLSFMLHKPKKLYTFKKVNLAYFRIRNRVLKYDQEVANEALENAAKEAQLQQMQQAQLEAQKKAAYNLDLDSDLKSFLSPDALVEALRKAQAGIVDKEDEDSLDESLLEGEQEPLEEVNEGVEESTQEEASNDAEDVLYVDSEGNEISKEEYEALNGIPEAVVESPTEEDDEEAEEVDEEIEEENEMLAQEKALQDQINLTALKVAGNWLKKTREEEQETSIALDDIDDQEEDTPSIEENEEVNDTIEEAPKNNKKVVVTTTSGGIATVKKANPFKKKEE